MARSYYILAVRNDGIETPRDDADWSPQFGDYDRECVEFERDDYRDHGARARDLKIVKLPNARQSTVNAAIAALNGDTTNARLTVVNSNFLTSTAR